MGNTVQLYMKVPGCRTPGHQENLNFSAININTGPGDVEWYCVHGSYWSVFDELAKKNGLTAARDSWWPNLDDLWRAKVPVYRFVQKPGDTVVLNSGTVHWVQSLGWCNNIAWNVGTMNPHVYKSAIIKYEYNKLDRYKSIVAMEALSWNLARNVSIHDKYLFTMMKSFLARNLVFWYKLEKRLKQADVPRIFHYPQLDDEAVFCEKCDKEVYCIIFASKPDENEVQGKHTPHCVHCALKVQIQPIEGGSLKRLEDIPFSQHRFSRFVVLQQYTIGDLMDTYDRFRLNY